MLISRNFLQELVDVSNIKSEDLANKLTQMGLEVEEVFNLGNINNLIIGEVVELNKHPEADKLNIAKVNIGSEELQIVCGAPNISISQKVIVACTGAVLPGDFKIKQAKLRGVESNGMICSLVELGINSKFLTQDQIDGIEVLNDDAPIGKDPLEYLSLKDEIIEVDLTANRADCFAYRNIAYEVAAILNKDFKDLSLESFEESIENKTTIKIQSDDCSYFSLRVFENVVVETSPSWLKGLLISNGIKPINNVVDLGNFVMLLTGSPMHVYDASKSGYDFIVRNASKSEKVVTLDDMERTLNDNELVIANDSEILGLAGAMGSKNSQVTMNTKTVILESAIFERSAMNRVMKSQNIHSDAVMRFFKGFDANILNVNNSIITSSLNKHTKALASNLNEIGDIKQVSGTVDISIDFLIDVLGIDISIENIQDIFKRLKLENEIKDNVLKVTRTTRRPDIEIAEDLIEEVARVYGYENIESKVPVVQIDKVEINPDLLLKRSIKNKLISLGSTEVINYTLIPEDKNNLFVIDQDLKNINLVFPITNQRTTLRHSLIYSLIENAKTNFDRGEIGVDIFEISSVYQGYSNGHKEVTLLSMLVSGDVENDIHDTKRKYDFYDVKGLIEGLFPKLNLSFVPFEDNNDYHPGKSAKIYIEDLLVGVIGCAHPTIEKEEKIPKGTYFAEMNLDIIFELLHEVRSKIKFTKISKYQASTRDMTIVINKNQYVSEIIDLIKSTKTNQESILNKYELIDVFNFEEEKIDKIALTYRFTYQDQNKTLTDEEINEHIELIEKIIKERGFYIK